MESKSVEGAPKNDVNDVARPDTGSPRNKIQESQTGQKNTTMVSQHPTADGYTPGEVNMEAEIAPDDVTRAGGFGARDDISSFLPVASDFTDFESTIRDARNYEEPEEEIHRPGLGWTGSSERK